MSSDYNLQQQFFTNARGCGAFFWLRIAGPGQALKLQPSSCIVRPRRIVKINVLRDSVEATDVSIGPFETGTISEVQTLERKMPQNRFFLKSAWNSFGSDAKCKDES
jgi:hypothetical protein